MDQHYQFNNRIISATFLIIIMIAGFWLLGYAIQFFLLIFSAILLAVLLRGGANFFKKKLKVPDWLGLLMSTSIFFIFLIGIFVLIVPRVAEQTEEIRQQAPEAWESLKSNIEQTEIGAAILDRAGDGEGLMPDDERLMELAERFFTGTFGVLGDIFIVLIIGIFFAASPQLYVQGVVILAAPRYRHRLEDVMYQVYDALKLWLIGKFLAMLFVGIATAIAMALMDIPAALALGFIAFLLDFIPNIGPIIAAIPAVLLAFLQSPMTALWVGVVYLVIQQIESMVLVPLIYKKTVSISPVITLGSLVLLGILAGPLGVIMATPLMACIQVMLRELYIKDYLEKDLDDEDENSFEKRMENT